MLAKHLLSQTDTLLALGKVGLRSALGKKGAGGGTSQVTRVLPPRPDGLIDDYVRVVGGDVGAYRRTVPPHLFPQWMFAMGAEVWSGLPYDPARVLNLGATMEVIAPIPRGAPLECTFRLSSVDDDGTRVVLGQTLETKVEGAVRLRAELAAYIPLAKKKDDGGKRKEPARVPLDASELSFERLPADLGRRFAFVTGDVNPLHWIGPYARAAGFRSPILHGYCTFARAFERLVRAQTGGDPSRVSRFEAAFRRPLPLPARVGTYVRDHELFVGDAPGGAAYLTGAFRLA